MGNKSLSRDKIIKIIEQLYDESFSKVDYLNRETVDKFIESEVNDSSRFLYLSTIDGSEEFGGIR